MKLRYLLFRSGSKFGLTTSPFNLESTIVLEGYIYNYSSEDFQCPDKFKKNISPLADATMRDVFVCASSPVGVPSFDVVGKRKRRREEMSWNLEIADS